MTSESHSGNKTFTNPHAGQSSTEGHSAGSAAGLLRILQFEADLRRIESERELAFYLANESRQVLGFRQAFVFRKRRQWRLEAVSSVTNFDRQSSVNRQMTQLVSGVIEGSETGVKRLSLTEASSLESLRDYMFPQALWMPLTTRKGRVFGGLLVLHEKPWSEPVLPLAERVAEAGAHAWQSLEGRRLDRRRWLPPRIIWPALLLTLCLLGFVQAPLTVLAPVEVTSQERLAVPVPIQGVIDTVEVEPNQPVNKGDVLVRLEDTELRNKLAIASRKVAVAQARLTQLQNASFVDREAARELKVAQAELALAQSERELAEDRLDRATIRAREDGVAVFDDPTALTGRPVSVGEKIMELVSPETLEFTVRLPVMDNIDLEEGDRARIFLDGDPLAPIDARLTRTSYRAVTQPDGSFAYTLKAGVAEGEQGLEDVRVGAYGTAQLYGEEHSLYYIVFRRPLSWVRQTLGI
ncbi:efflux RND transporter periplasmic adaptor subunit [Halomonas halmophila]|uniref:Uncharacterized protein n=1 Tax=Halomonas halmophila TaxID=252 RepID=A0A4Y4ETL2_9GAMM|nr:HlyD family efflux transporter periplasmic adaptor subunit [Halomonas halmophila]GED21232.1 hypothetical protein HHA01_02090 [Halomonas halmophila]